MPTRSQVHIRADGEAGPTRQGFDIHGTLMVPFTTHMPHGASFAADTAPVPALPPVPLHSLLPLVRIIETRLLSCPPQGIPDLLSLVSSTTRTGSGGSFQIASYPAIH